MVAGCPKCSARYRVDVDRIGPDGAKLRCTKCSAVFLVRAPKTSPKAPPAPIPEPVAAPAVETPPQSEVATPDAAEDAAEREPTPVVDPARLVIVADPEEERGKQTAEAIRGWGLTPHLVLDGVEAMLAIQRMLPAAVVLDAALPKMFGFQVCEVVKRNESLQHTRVVLVGAIHHQDRYRRDPSDLYGADVYVEQPDLPDGLKAIFEEAGLPLGGPANSDLAEESATASIPPPAPDVPVEFESPSAAEPAPEPEFDFEEPVVPAESESSPEPDTEDEFEFELKTPLEAAPASSPVRAEPAPVAADEDPEITEERERALRLARIAVSEMLLYSPDKFENAIRDGNLEQALDLEIQEARALLRQRISEEVRAETDFIIDELNRVAAERGNPA